VIALHKRKGRHRRGSADCRPVGPEEKKKKSHKGVGWGGGRQPIACGWKKKDVEIYGNRGGSRAGENNRSVKEGTARSINRKEGVLPMSALDQASMPRGETSGRCRRKKRWPKKKADAGGMVKTK